MSLVLLGSTSGSVTLQEPAIAGSTVIDLPATSGTMAVTSGSPSFTNITATGTLTVNGNTTLGDASTDTILMTGAPSIGGAGLGMGMGFRNRIINGAMVIDQRNAGASVTASATSAMTYVLDRWGYQVTQASKFTVQQNAGSVTPPTGFTKYLGVTVGASANVIVVASDYFAVSQRIEGFNAADFGWGAAGASAVTLSFWVRSSLTGTFGGSIINSAYTRSYPFTYTISAANTWEQKSVTIAGDTSGTWLTDNSTGIQLWLSIGAGSTNLGTAGSWAGTSYLSATGSTNLITTNSATFYITGVQLEKGSTATSFDYRPYSAELALCQRYYQKFIGTGSGTQASVGAGLQNTTASAQIYIKLTTTMRSKPTSIMSGLQVSDETTFDANATLGSISAGTDAIKANTSIASSGAQFRPVLLNIPANSSGYIDFSAEL